VFTPAEWRTVRVLVDIVIPKDARSGSATDARVPEFMDVFMENRENMRTWMRTGLTWLDDESRKRFSKAFVDGDAAQRTAVLDDIAWPRRARQEMQPGVRFFNNFRNFTASGFWSSKIGVDDLQYMGNRPIARWDGCPAPALNKLGVRYR
jgi:gluconate 2-dehydrogenase gamma chain